MTGATEFRLFMQWLEKSLLVKGRLGLDHLLIQPLQKWTTAERKRVMLRCGEREIGVTPWTIDMSDRMANRAGDTCAGERVVRVTETGVVKDTAQQRHRVVAACAEAGLMGVTVQRHTGIPSIHDRKAVSGIVE